MRIVCQHHPVYWAAFAGKHILVGDGHHGKYHIVVCGVHMVPVAEPIASPLVYLNVSDVSHSVYLDLGIKKIRPGIPILITRVNDFDSLSRRRKAVSRVKKGIFPNVLQKFFCHMRVGLCPQG